MCQHFAQSQMDQTVTSMGPSNGDGPTNLAAAPSDGGTSVREHSPQEPSHLPPVPSLPKAIPTQTNSPMTLATGAESNERTDALSCPRAAEGNPSDTEDNPTLADDVNPDVADTSQDI
ncbi:hypothetical protein C8Q78DRAFT_1084108 [Trametes maxima]|nr:hypothetical protein C8Q78DRAFT_1084108 [Trametes maxima]